VGAGIAALGFPDPRKEVPGAEQNHPLLVSFLKALADEDDPTKRAYPTNLTIIQHLPLALSSLYPSEQTGTAHIADLCLVGFFWLLRPAEYLAGAGQTRSKAFRLQDISFLVGSRSYLATDNSLNDLMSSITRATMTFNDQKNSVRGEQISHAATTHPQLCPCKSLARLCRHLRDHSAPINTPIHTYYRGNPPSPHLTHPADITASLRIAATQLEAQTGIDASLLTARSLRPGGATALLCAGVDSDVIQLLGRWKSDAMLRYLRIAAHAHSNNLAQSMLTAGHYTFAPHTFTSEHAQPIPNEAPPKFVQALLEN
jgi:hypothetical protein